MKACCSLSLVLVVGACRTADTTPPRATSPDEALLVEVSPAQLGHITVARAACDRAGDAYAAAQSHGRQSSDLRDGARLDRSAVLNRVARAEAVLATALANGTTNDGEMARRELAVARSEAAIAEATLVLRGSELVHADALTEVARLRLKVAEARVELAKVVAVNTLARPGVQKPEVAIFEERVRQAEGDERIAAAKADTAEKEVAIHAGHLRTSETTGSR